MKKVLSVLWLWVCMQLAVHAQAVLQPPFGLKWGDAPEKLVGWAAKHSLDTTITLPGDQPAVKTVRVSARKGNLPGSGASAVEGRFHSGQLYEIAIHYTGDGSTSADAMEERYITLRRELVAEYGELVPNRQDRTIEDQFATRTTSSHREPVRGLFLLLARTEVEDLLRSRREVTFSLLYRNDNLHQELVRKAGAGEKPER